MDDDLAERIRESHRREYPNCTYGDKPHYVPPSSGQVGFYLCDVPADLTNRSRVEITSSPVSTSMPPGEFYEDDEPVEDVIAAFDAGIKMVTSPPVSGAPVTLTSPTKSEVAAAVRTWHSAVATDELIEQAARAAYGAADESASYADVRDLYVAMARAALRAAQSGGGQ